MSEPRIGACSWKYPSWEGLVYSAAHGIDYLREYATRYDTVEVDQWFWSLFGPASLRLPDAADALAYRRAVPDTFRFTIKAPDSLTLTHYRRRARSASAGAAATEPLVPNPNFLSPDLLRAYWQTIAPLHDVLGVTMFQFEYLNRLKMSGQSAFQQAIAAFAPALPAGFSFGLETRNPNYLNAAFFDLLLHLGIAPVLLEGYYMPPVAQVYHRWRERLLQFPTVVIRLHGPDREGMEAATGQVWNTVVAPKDAALVEIASITRDLLAAGARVYINVNNHYEGSAPLTIARLRRLL
jgi:uncharacterized protein YecE (DUF72 family)